MQVLLDACGTFAQLTDTTATQMSELSLRDTIYIGSTFSRADLGQNMPTSRSECHVRNGRIHRHNLTTIDLD